MFPIRRVSCSFLAAVCCWASGLICADESKVDFARDVAPILRDHCVSCHGPDLEIGDLRLYQRKLDFAGEEVIKPGDSKESLLIKRLREDKKLGIRMPPTGPAL